MAKTSLPKAVSVKPELGYYESMLFNSLELAAEKIYFLLRIPQIYDFLANGGDENVRSKWSPKLVDALYHLRNIQLTTEANQFSRNETPSSGNQVGNSEGNGFPFSEWKKMTDASHLKSESSRVQSSDSAAATSMREKEVISGTTTLKGTLDRHPSNGFRISRISEHMSDEGDTNDERSSTLPSFPVSSFLLEIPPLYRVIFRELTRSWTTIPKAINISMTSFKISNNGLLPPASKGLEMFREYFTKLTHLVKKRLLSHNLTEMQILQNRWKREQCIKKLLLQLQKEEADLGKKWGEKIAELDFQIKLTTKEIDDQRKKWSAGLKTSLIGAILPAKKRCREVIIDDKKLSQPASISKNSIDYLRKEDQFHSVILDLENELRTIIRFYDSSMAERQKKLDWMKKEMEENEKTISILEQAFADTDDRFEEMRITKRLQELLHNMEMADNFKRNRAARVIQNVWRRYWLRKLKKLRRKARIRRKPRIPGESRVEKKKENA